MDQNWLPNSKPQATPASGLRYSGSGKHDERLTARRGAGGKRSVSNALEALEVRLQRLEDLQAITQLFIDYGRFLDGGDFESYALLFAEDGEVLLGPMGRATGPQAIKELMVAQLSASVGETYHLISSPMISLNGDQATSSTMWTVMHRSESGAPRVTMVGRHEDILVRSNEGWRFKQRRGFVDLPSVMPAR